MFYFEYFLGLSSLTISSIVSFFGFITIIDNFMLLILFTTLFRFLTQIVDKFQGSWSSYTSMGLNNCFTNSLLKASRKAVWLCLYFNVTFRIPTSCFASNTNATSLAFLVLRVLATLYLDVTSVPVDMYLNVFSYRHYGAHKADQIAVAR